METPPRARWTRASRRAPASGPPVRKDAGKGRVVYIPGIVFEGPLPEHGGYFEINNRFWKLPKNWTELTDAVRWAARQDIPVQIDAPSYVAVNVVAQPKERRWLVHLVNYNASSGTPAKSIEVTCSLPGGNAPREVTLYSSDLSGPVPAKIEGSTFSVPELKVYTVVAVRW